MDAWITVALDETTFQAALDLGQSLRNVSTKKDLIVLVAESLRDNLKNELQKLYDKIETVRGDSNESFEEAARRESIRLNGIRRGIFLSPFITIVKNSDHVFERLICEQPEKGEDKKDQIITSSSYFGFSHSDEQQENDSSKAVNSSGSSWWSYSSFTGKPADKEKPETRNNSTLPGIYSLDKLMEMGLNIKVCSPPSSSGNLLETETNEPIAIIGMSCRFPKSNSPEELWSLIASMEEAVGPIPPSRTATTEGWNSSVVGGFLNINVGELDGSFFEMSRAELNVTDPQQRLSLEVSWEALEDARIDPHSLKGTKLGVFSGTWITDYKDILTSKRIMSKEGQILRRYVGNGHGAIPGRLSYFYGGQGPSITTDSACSSSMGALALAISSLRKGTSNVALAVGANLVLFPYDPKYDVLLSPDGRCKTFEQSADGFGRAEGIATLVLKRLSDAQRDGDRIHSLLVGVGSCTKSLEGSLVTPDVDGEVRCMQMALKDAGVKPQDVRYIEIHGTGTAAGDFTEVSSVTRVFDDNTNASVSGPLYIGSVKANIAHPEGCSGLAGIIKTTLALKKKVIPPHRKIREINKKLKLEETNRIQIPHEVIPWETSSSSSSRRLAGVSSFGLLGTYYHVIMEDYDNDAALQTKRDGKQQPLPWSILTFSAKSEFSLKKLLSQYPSFWNSDPQARPSIPNLAFSTSTTRAHLNPFRASSVISSDSDWSDFEKRLQNVVNLVKICSSSKPKTCFLLTGQGSQYFGMGKGLYGAYPAFKAAFDRCQAILKDEHDVDLSSYLWGNPEEYSDSKVLYNQTGIFTMEYCMSQLLKSLGVSPSVVLGHSLGEYSAACISEILTLENALSLIVKRAKLLLASPSTGNSAMLAIKAKPNVISDVIAEYSRKFPGNSPPEISAINSPEQIVLGGPEDVIKRTKEIVESRGVVCVQLSTSHAFHSSLMEPILPEYEKFASTVPHGSPSIKFISSVSGNTHIPGDSITNWPQYWRDVTRKPVDFAGACQSESLVDVDIFVEIGPHPVLCGLLASNLPQAKTVFTMKRGTDDIKCFSEALSSLYTLGHDIDWKSYYAPYDVRAVDLPFYQFNRKFYWLSEEEVNEDDDEYTMSSPSGISIHPLLGSHAWTAQNFHVFDTSIDLKKKTHTYLNDHMLGGTFVFPGAGHVEIALSTANFLGKKPTEAGGNLVVENLEISNPLGKNDNNSLHIQTNATPEADGSFSIEVFSSGESSDSKWNSHATCSSYVTFKVQPRQNYVKIPTQDLTSGGISTHDYYTKYDSLGYTFGSDFQRLREYWKISDLTTIFRMDLRGLESSRYILHPVVIDAMLVACTFVENTKQVFTVPVSIRKLTAYVPNSSEDEVFIHITRDTDDGLTHIILVNQNQDSVIAVMEGLTTVETTVAKIKQSLVNTGSDQNPRILKQFWETAAETLPEDGGKFSVPNLKSICSTIYEDEKVDLFVLHGDEFALLGNIICLYYQKAFVLMGFNKNPGECFKADDLANELRIIPSLRRFFDLILANFCEDGLLEETTQKGSFKLLKTIPPISQLDTEINLKSEKIEKVTPELRAAHACLEPLPGNLQGTSSILPVLFPSEETLATSDISAVKFYQNSEWYFKVHSVMGRLLRRVLESGQFASNFNDNDEAQKPVLRILEVGGGTGTATSEVIPLLESLNIPYHYEFTDISPAFFAATEERIRKKMTGGKGTFQSSVFDLEVDALSQGFRPFDFHVIVASMVLHATSDLRKTCLNLRKVSQGVVCVLEGKGARREIDAVFGQVEGYWLFEDDVRTFHPNVPADKWIECLGSCGFNAESVTWDGAVVLLGESTPIPFYEDNSRVLELQKLPTWILYIPESIRSNLLELCNALRNTGRNVVLVGNPDDATTAINSSIAVLEGFFYAAGLEENPTDPESMLKNFLALMQTIISLNTSNVFPRIVVPVRGVWYFDETDVPLEYPPFAASLWGLSKTIRSEYPAMNVKSIDIDSKTLPVQVWLRELFPVDGEPQIAYRGEERLVLKLKDSTKEIEASARTLSYPKSPAFQLALPASCAINDLSYIPHESPPLLSTQVSIDVQAVGLNFKDVLCVLKPSEFFRTKNAFGMDIAGVITGIGSDVPRKDIKVGDRIAIYNDKLEPFSSSTVLETHTLIKLPPTWSMEDGATVIVPFITAYYCLITVAQMKASDTVFIHTGSGGVGIAAIQLAKYIGARVISTAGNKRKRAYLKSLGVDVALSSRTLDFGPETMKATNGRGVDIVLNSLTGEGFVETALKTLAKDSNARFIEMSKLNTWTEEQVADLRPDIKYWAVYAADLDAKTFSSVSLSLEDLMWSGKIFPLPQIHFPASGIIAAAKYLQEGKHIGKVVLKLPTSSPQPRGIFKDNIFSPNGLYLITGGFGGIGIEIARWMVDNGARHLILCGRRPNPQLVEDTVEMLKELGALSVTSLMFDIGNAQECRAHLLRVIQAHPTLPLRGIMHCAGVLSDAVLTNQTYEKFQETLNPKWTGTWILHKLSLELNLPLDYFVMFSSTAALVGPLGQANHTVANAVMDAIAWHRYSLGYSATTINWGQWGQIGVAADIKLLGYEPFTPQSAIDKLEKALLVKETQVAITSDVRLVPDIFSWAQDTYFNDGSQDRRNKAKKLGEADSDSAKAEGDLDILHNWPNAKDSKEKLSLLKNHVSSTVRNLLQLDSNEFLDLTISLHQLGLDSLMMIQLKNKMVKDLESIGLPPSIKLANTDTVTSIAETLLVSLEGGNKTGLLESSEEPLDYPKLIHDDSQLPEDFVKTVETFPAGQKVTKIFMTGATGHLGIFMLQMLTWNESIEQVYCLVRKSDGGNDNNSLIGRLKAMTKKYNISDPDWTKVTPVEGAVTQEKLGLGSKIFDHLTNTVDGVIHNAAKVNHTAIYRKTTPVDPENDVRTVNVEGLKRVLEFTCSGRPKKFCYAGTFVASREPDVVTNKMNEEWCRDDEFDNCVNLGYPTSKFIGEKLVKAAVERGMAGYILRLPFIGGDTANGVINNVQENHMILRFISYLQTGVIPRLPTPMNFIPVDVCAKLSLAVYLSENKEVVPGVYNVLNPHPNRETDFLTVAKEEFGINLRLVEFDEFLKEIQSCGNKSSLLPLMDFYERREILKYLTESPLYAAWLENESDYFKSQKLTKLLGNEYTGIEKPMDTMVRDLLAAKKDGLFQRFGVAVPKK